MPQRSIGREKRRYMMQFDYVVVGGGLAGLYTAYLLSSKGSVALVTCTTLEESNSYFAQGGMAAVTEASDTPKNHFEDTIEAGRGLCSEAAVRILTEEAPQRIEELIDLGMHFDTEDGHLALGLEGGHHHRRILHAGGDATGRMVTSFMTEQVRKTPNIKILDHYFALGLIVTQGQCFGLYTYNQKSHESEAITAHATILATGGAGALYHPTTNPPTALGDGLGMALAAGATLRDLEFVQFHPTALYVPGQASFLISEAVRGEGAHLYNQSGERFMLAKHPLAELAPRDVVAREIFHQIEAEGGDSVTLSLRHLDAEHIRHRFPTIAQHCAEIGLDLTQEIPVAPAAHYTVGGVATDLNGATSVRQLYAVGEVASTGVMGANRLASNSLVECLVFGKRIADHIHQHPYPQSLPSESPLLHREFPLSSYAKEQEWREQEGKKYMLQLGKLLMKHVGIVRTEASLSTALEELNRLISEISIPAQNVLSATIVSQRLHLARCLVRAALERKESRGGHFRSDYPETLPNDKAYHSLITQESIKQVFTFTSSPGSL